MPRNLSSDYQEIPPGCPAYDYDNPSLPFTLDDIAAIDCIKEFLSEGELAQARRLETVYFSHVMKIAGGRFIPGLRQYSKSFSMYLRRFNNREYGDLLDGFIEKVYDSYPKSALGGVNFPGFRVVSPLGERYYSIDFHGNIRAWIDGMIMVAAECKTTMAWFEKGKFCSTDGRRVAFGDLTIERLEGCVPVPDGW